jgi:hypothetical protein
MPRAPVLIIIATIAAFTLHGCEARAHPAWGITVDRDNQIYFSDLETIWKIDAGGKLSVFKAGQSGRHIHELMMDESGNLYGEELTYDPATELFTAALWKMTPAGNFSYTLRPTTSPPKAMSIWRTPDGNTYSASWKSNAEHETLILRRTPEGKVTVLLGSAETADKFRQVVLYSIGGMAFGSDRSLYVADGANIWKVWTDGRVTALARNLAPEKPLDSPAGKSATTTTSLLGIAVDAEGAIFAADLGNRRVLKLTPEGKVTTLVQSERPWSPSGVALKDGNLYILEYGFTPPRTTHGARVRKLSPDGKLTVLATGTVDGNSANPESSSNEQAQPEAATTPKAMYAVIAAIAGICALTIIIWRARRSAVNLSASGQ